MLYPAELRGRCDVSMAYTEGAVLDSRHFPAPEAKRHTFTDLIDRYICEVLPHKRPSTIPTQRQHLRWWQTHLGHSLLADITLAVLIEYRTILAHGRANATVVRYLAVLSHAFTMAMREWQWCDDNPVRKISKPKEPRGRVRFLSDDERQGLLDVCKASDSPYLYTVVVLALSTGARKMELLNLTWRDVDFQRGVITLHDTKNGERRVLPLAGHALALMHEQATIQRKEASVVFLSQDGKAPRDIRTAWEHAIKRAGIANLAVQSLKMPFGMPIRRGRRSNRVEV